MSTSAPICCPVSKPLMMAVVLPCCAQLLMPSETSLSKFDLLTFATGLRMAIVPP